MQKTGLETRSLTKLFIHQANAKNHRELRLSTYINATNYSFLNFFRIKFHFIKVSSPYGNILS